MAHGAPGPAQGCLPRRPAPTSAADHLPGWLLLPDCLPAAAGDFSEGGLAVPQETLAALVDEAEVMARMRHPAIVQFYAVCTLPACIITGEQCWRVVAREVVMLVWCGPLGALTPIVPSLARASPAPPPPPEFCSRGSLYDVLRKARGSPAAAAELTWESRLRMVRVFLLFC